MKHIQIKVELISHLPSPLSCTHNDLLTQPKLSSKKENLLVYLQYYNIILVSLSQVKVAID